MIVITGTPGTGKTTLSKELAKKLDLPLINVTELVKKKKLYTKKESDYLVVDLKKLKKELKNFEGIADGHVLCDISLPATVIVLRTSPKTIKRRLSKRPYSKQKVIENVEAEALDYCSINSRENYKKVLDVNVTGLTHSQALNKVIEYLKKSKTDFVDWSNYFM